MDIVLIVMLGIAIAIAGMAYRLALSAAEDAMATRKDLSEMQSYLSRTMQINAWFHARTQALIKGEEEPPRPEV